MKLKGSIEVHRVCAKTNRILEVIKKNNLIPNNSLIQLLTWNSYYNYFGSKKISISTSTATPNALVSDVPNIIATGYVPGGVTSPTWNDGIDPPFGQIQNRIDFIGVSRTFDTVALTDLLSENIQLDITTTAAAYVKLDSTCTQGEYEYLDIFYRIQFSSGDGEGFLDSDAARYDFGQWLFGQSSDGWGFKISYLYASPFGKPNASYTKPWILGGVYIAGFVPNPPFGGLVQGWDSYEIVNDHFKFKYILSDGQNDNLGIIFNGMLQGYANENEAAYSFNKYEYDVEPWQTGFWHSSSATVPFFDPSTNGASNGSITFSGTWTGKWPQLFKINIVGTGATGVATYKFSVRNHLGFEGNTYSDRTIPNPFCNPNINAANGLHGYKEENNNILRWSSTKIVQYDDTGVTLLDLFDGTFQYWDSTTTPALPATEIRQCAVDPTNNKIYVGCRDTGLYVINPNANTVTLQLNNACYGVDVGRSGKAIAIVNGGLYTSSNWSTPVSFTYTGISDSNWGRVWFLKADPEHVNDRVCIVSDNGSGTNKLVWFQLSDNSTADGYEGSEIKKWAASLDVADTGSFWAIAGYKLTYGTNVLSPLSVSPTSKSLNSSLWGTDNYYKIDFYNGNLICSDRLLSSADATVTTYTTLDSSATTLHLDGGITLFSKMRQLFTDNSYCWVNYGWNGSAWEINHAGSRTTHTTAQTLIDGVQATFANGASTPHFTATNYLTRSVNKGILKDNATISLTYQSAWYSVPTQLTETASGTVPASPPYILVLAASVDPAFIQIETDSPELHKLKLNGTAVIRTYTDGSTPGPNEISLSAAGVATFNAADAGKTLSGTYAWVKY